MPFHLEMPSQCSGSRFAFDKLAMRSWKACLICFGLRVPEGKRRSWRCTCQVCGSSDRPWWAKRRASHPATEALLPNQLKLEHEVVAALYRSQGNRPLLHQFLKVAVTLSAIKELLSLMLKSNLGICFLVRIVSSQTLYLNSTSLR